MPFKEISKVMMRRELVNQMLQPGANKRELYRRYGVTSRTGYKWLRRFLEGGVEALEDKSRRPKGSPNKTVAEVEKEVLKLIAEGYKSPRIAELLNNGVKNVYKHRSNIMEKLDLHNVATLTAYAIGKGFTGAGKKSGQSGFPERTTAG